MADQIAAAVRQAVTAALSATSTITTTLPDAGRAPKTASTPSVAPAAPVARATAIATAKAKAPAAKRSWPTCSVAGCGGKFFPPSGTERRLCYKHFLEAGGIPPLAKVKNPAKGKAAR